MERSGPSIEIKIVLLVTVVVVVQDAVVLAMHFAGAPSAAMQVALGGILVLALIVAAVWGNTVARAVRRLTRACFVARKGDVRVLTEPARTDELGELNGEINKLVVLVRELTATESDLAASSRVTEAVSGAAPEMLRSSHELLVSLKELKEGASAGTAILRKVGGNLGEARTLLAQVAGRVVGGVPADEIATKLDSLGSIAREAELLADEIIDEVARPEIDEAVLARAVNGMREVSRTIAEIAGQAAAPLRERRADATAASLALERLGAAEQEKADARRVSELMDRSAARGLSEATRLATALRRLGLVLEAYVQRGRLGA